MNLVIQVLKPVFIVAALMVAAAACVRPVAFVGPQGMANLRNPSDNSLAVGPDHIMQTVNTRLAIFTKKGKKYDTTGKPFYGPVPNNTVFKGFGDDVIQKHACAVERAKMLRGEPAREQCVIIDGVNFLNNADVDGRGLPPPGAPNIMMAAGGTQLKKVFEDDGINFHVDWQTLGGLHADGC